MNNIFRIVRWLKGLGHGRGFGIQSPWAYRFVRYVVNEESPYYAYSVLKKDTPDISPLTLRLCRLCFRLANYVQASLWNICVNDAKIYEKYVHAGCHNSKVTTCSDKSYDIDDKGMRQVLLTSLYEIDTNQLEEFIEYANPTSILMVTDLYADDNTLRIWNKIAEDSRTVITFDLYHCGIVFFNKKRHKRNYIVNF